MLSGRATASNADPPADRILSEYFRLQTAALERAPLTQYGTSKEKWEGHRAALKRELKEMLGLHPMPSRTPLNAEVTGVVKHEDFQVEKLHFQSLPGLYVTANLYLPNKVETPLPTILYVCGHSYQVKDGVSYGNKTGYQHHGEWFARNGYACLTIDTLQLGEIQGIHHGTYREGMWWWIARGYTPAGVEAWNCVRALDYLETREEVDPQRIGVTGRSGGGAYSWWIAAMDDRIKAAAPVAGITDLHNHIVDGVVEGHCDCMYFLNTYQWDYATVAALVAPRPLILVNTDSDRIFPLDGVYRVHNQVEEIYSLYNAEDQFGLVITPGPHADSQPLRIPVFHFFNRHLKNQEELIATPAEKLFDRTELKVFDELPEQSLNAVIHESFVPKAAPSLPSSEKEWNGMSQQWRRALDEEVFRAWPDSAESLKLKTRRTSESEGITLRMVEFTSQSPYRLPLYIFEPSEKKKSSFFHLHVLDEHQWSGFIRALRERFEWKEGLASQQENHEGEGHRFELERWLNLVRTEGRAIAFLAPRGIGPTAWSADARKEIQIRRRFMLLGQTLDGMRTWDIRRGIAALRSMETQAQDTGSTITLSGKGRMGANVLYASLYEDQIVALDLEEIPATHREGPIYLNVLKHFDLPQALALAGERCRVELRTKLPEKWTWATQTSKVLEWPSDRVRLIQPSHR